MAFWKPYHTQILLLAILSLPKIEAGAEEFNFFNDTFDFPEEFDECPFDPDKVSTLFENQDMLNCVGENLWKQSSILSRALTSPPDNPFDTYAVVNQTFCPLWLSKGRSCIQNYLISHCTKFQFTRSQTNNALNFIVTFSDAFCNEGPGKDAFFELAKLGALDCMKDHKNYQKPFIACLNRADYITDLLPIFLGYFQTCSQPLWKDCKGLEESDRNKFEGLFKILFKDMSLLRRIFWREFSN